MVFYAPFKSSMDAETGQIPSTAHGIAEISDGCLLIDRGYVRYNDSLDTFPDGSSSFIIEFDFYPVKSYHAGSAIVSWGGGTPGGSNWVPMAIAYGYDGNINFPGWHGGQSVDVDRYIGSWIHVECGYNKEQQRTYIKINGEIVLEKANSFNKTVIQGFSIGNPYWVGGDYCAFKIKELKIYKN